MNKLMIKKFKKSKNPLRQVVKVENDFNKNNNFFY
jgi:hypothetical protein